MRNISGFCLFVSSAFDAYKKLSLALFFSICGQTDLLYDFYALVAPILQYYYWFRSQ